MAAIKVCDVTGCRVTGLTGKNGKLTRKSVSVYFPPESKAPFDSLTFMADLCDDHVDSLRMWGEKMSGQASFDDVELPADDNGGEAS